jgi:DNA-binding NarL/FixJ family response regulator
MSKPSDALTDAQAMQQLNQLTDDEARGVSLPALLSQARKLEQRAGALSAEVRGRILNRLGNLNNKSGFVADAILNYTAALREARAADVAQLEAQILSNLGNAQSLLQLHEEARASYQRSIEIRRAKQLDNTAVLLNLGLVLVELGDARSARELLVQAASQARVAGNDYLHALALANLAECLGLLKSHQEAIKQAHAAQALAQRLSSTELACIVDYMLGLALLRAGDPQQGRVALERALRLAEEGGLHPQRARLHKLLSECHEAGDEPQHALAHARKLFEQEQALFRGQAEQRARLAAQQMLHSELAGELAKERASNAELRSRNRRLLSQVHALQSRAPVNAPADAAPAAARPDAGLSPRQTEILQLICDGLTNKEIAARLETSPHTVRHQVSAVLKRLGVSTRGAAQAWAVKHLLPG